MPKQSTEKTIAKLREEIQRHEDLYYVRDDPEISDRDYDELIEKLRALESKHPEFLTPDSPTQRVGGRPAEGFPEFIHRRPMLSLDNSYSSEELRVFDERCRKLAGGAAQDIAERHRHRVAAGGGDVRPVEKPDHAGLVVDEPHSLIR